MTKIIHQIWFDFGNGKGCNNELIILRDYILSTNSDFRYILWSYDDAAHFIKEHYVQYYAFFCGDTNRPIIKCDFFRYIILYHFGGFYMDIDFMVIGNLKDLIIRCSESEVILSCESHNCIEMHNTLHNGFMYSAKPRCEFFKHISDAIIQHNVANISEQDVYRISGTKLLCSFWKKFKHIHSICVLPFQVVCSHWFINSNKDMVLFNNKNNNVTTCSTNSEWSFLTIEDVKINKEALLQNGAVAVCTVMKHGSYWK
jgi:mannosyltransferase OCH1-like enzyme